MTNEELVYLYQQGDKQALDKLISNNTGIVYKLANKFYIEGSNSIDREDLEQEGVIGLITAANKYDFNNPKKAKFITYAIHWVYQKIHRYVSSKNTNKETSLNIPIGEDGKNELLDIIEGVDHSFENVEEKLYIQKLHEDLEEVMNNYNTLQERQILKFRHGWDNIKPMNLREIGELLNVQRERVRQVESKARRKIRNTPWGRDMAKEIHSNRIIASRYSINKSIDNMNFADKYLY